VTGRLALPWCAAAAAGWEALGQPAHVAGLGGMLAAAVAAAACLRMAVPGGRSAAGVLVPRQWRAAHRSRHGREHCASARHSKRLWALARFAGQYRCAFCGTRSDLQVDHYVPWSHGGLTALFNLMVLCGYHNRVRSNYWPGRHYRPFAGHDNEALAALIFAAEWRARRRPVHWVLAVLAVL